MRDAYIHTRRGLNRPEGVAAIGRNLHIHLGIKVMSLRRCARRNEKQRSAKIAFAAKKHRSMMDHAPASSADLFLFLIVR